MTAAMADAMYFPPLGRDMGYARNGVANVVTAKLKAGPLLLKFVGLLLCPLSLVYGANISRLGSMTLEELLDVEIVTVSKYGQKRSDIASSVTVIGKDQIRQFGHRNLSEVLRSVPGFYVTHNRVYDNAGVRGFDQSESFNGRILIMIDGIRMNEPIFDSGFTGNELPLDIDLVERVEILHGPGSSIYGSNAFFAVVNVITKNGGSYQGGEVAGAWGSFDAYKGRFSYGRKHGNGPEYLVSASGLNADGPTLYYPEAATPENPEGKTAGKNYEHAKQFFTKASWGNFNFEGGYGRRKKGLPGGAFDTSFDDPNSNFQDSEAFVNLQYQKALSPHFDFTGRAFYGDYDLKALLQRDAITNVELAHAWWTGMELRLLATHFEHHKILGGLEVQENWQQQQRNFNLAPAENFSDGDNNSHRIGIYLQDDITVNAEWKLSLGARYDDYSLVEHGMLSPRLGVIYNPFANTIFKLQYAKAFRAPPVSLQLDASVPEFDAGGNLKNTGTLINRGLHAEVIDTYELTWEQIFAKSWRLTTAGYFMELDKLFKTEWEGDSARSINQNMQCGYGVNFALSRQWQNGALLRTSYALQLAENHEGNALSNVPRHLYQLNLMAPLFSPAWHGGLELQALSKRQGPSGSTPSFARVNLSLLYQPLPNVGVSASVYDLFDNNRQEPGALAPIPQDGRTFRLKLDYRF